MEQLRLWILGIAVTSLLLGLGEALVTQKGIQQVLRLAGGVLLIVVLLGPIGKMSGAWQGFSLEDYRSQIASREEELREEQEENLSAIIESQLDEYIWDKAQAMGLDVTISVSTRKSSGGVALPDRVAIKGPYNAEFSRWLEEEMGVDAEHQIWQEE